MTKFTNLIIKIHVPKTNFTVANAPWCYVLQLEFERH